MTPKDDRSARRCASAGADSRAPRQLTRRTLLAGALATGMAAAATDWGWPHQRLVRGVSADVAAVRPHGQRPLRRPAATVIERRIRAYMADAGVPGVAVAYYAAGEEGLLSFGVADLDRQDPVTPDLAFTIGSVQKVFHATLLATQMVGDSPEKRLDDRVTLYLPRAVARSNNGLRRVTLRDLATHTSGLPGSGDAEADDPADELYADQPPSPELVEFWQTWTPPRRPGAAYEYSNVGFVTLAFAAVGRDGPPDGPGYNVLLRQSVTEPLGMTYTAPLLPAEFARASGYNRRGDGRLRLVEGEATGIKSTARDLLTWLKLQLGVLDGDIPPVLREAVALTQQVHWSDPDRNHDVGLGWESRVRRGEPRIWVKPGASGKSGHTSVVAFTREKQSGIAILANLNGDASPNGVGVDIVRTLSED